jgi:UDP-2,3-diacylglucosamine pyrophosphatase LpxH
MNFIILSDLHLGSRNCQVGPLSQILATHFDRLILNGDTINCLNLKKLKAKHWRLIDQLRQIARKRQLVLIRGNHDVTSGGSDGIFGPSDVLATLLGVPLHEEFSLKVGGRSYLVLHGDRFDPTIRWPIVTDAADWCYRTVQGVNKKVAHWVKRSVKQLGGAVEFVTQRAVDYAKFKGCDGIITGHTHFADDRRIRGVHFLNTGCWVDWPCTYISANASDIELKQWAGLLPKVGTPNTSFINRRTVGAGALGGVERRDYGTQAPIVA